MGYDVHITRKEEWSDEKGPRITEAEWQAYVKSDPEMVITGAAEHTNPQGDTIRLTQPLLSEWRHHSSGHPVWFSYFEGSLSVKNPDDECLAKMRHIATRLHARVQGDEGEFYDAQQKRPSFFKRLCSSMTIVRRSQPEPTTAGHSARIVPVDPTTLGFAVGDVVRDTWGNEHVVTEIDPQAEHGLGIIRTRRLSDGVVLGATMVAHDLKFVRKAVNEKG
jgi:hypothetical protein